jgi:microsomal dipeptidase-like Zn-dependent dipeptidase
MIADLHCHYPMHLLPQDDHPHGHAEGWLARLRNELQADIIGTLAPFLNDASWREGWRVDLDKLGRGGARLVCSVLYWPPAEFDFAVKYGSAPLPNYYTDLKYQLDCVEKDLAQQDPDGTRHVIARSPADLDDQRIAFVHCVEGGFHLGPDPNTIDAEVRWLAERGVAYITIAHLFYRQVASNAPAIPMLPDGLYEHLFPQAPGIGLTELGRATVKAMYRHKVLIDVSHMRQDALDATFALVKQLEEEDESDPDPKDFPLIATHVGMRDAGPDRQTYNLSADTAKLIQQRDGLIGLITAQHQLGWTHGPADSQAVVGRHLEAIAGLGNGHGATAIGTDLDGFIKPTLSGLDQASDLPLLAQWIEANVGKADAEAILYGNAHRVLKRAFETRERALAAGA